MMDAFETPSAGCAEALELVDAYALGAVDEVEADLVERHVAGCLRCWEELAKSQRTAALLALSVTIEQAPRHLGDRIMAQAEREGAAGPRAPVLGRLRLTRRMAVRAVAFAGVAALAFSAFLQVQMSDLRDDKDNLQQQLSATTSELEQQRQIVAVLSASDSRKLAMEAALRSQAESVYNWSRDNDAGFIVCRNFPAPPEGSVYQVWFTTEGHAEPVATFVPQDGGCQIPMDMSRVEWRPMGIGISVEPESGSERPSRRWFSYASFERPSDDGSGRSMGGIDVMVTVIGP